MRLCRALRVAGLVAGLAGLLLAATPGPAQAASTPRAQFFDFPNFGGLKLDKDVRSLTEPGVEANLAALGRSCDPFGCIGNWNNEIASLDTTGGGQPGAFLQVWDGAFFSGLCVTFPPGKRLFHLRSVTLQGFPTENWDRRISSFQVWPTLPPARPECALFAG